MPIGTMASGFPGIREAVECDMGRAALKRQMPRTERAGSLRKYAERAAVFEEIHALLHSARVEGGGAGRFSAILVACHFDSVE